MLEHDQVMGHWVIPSVPVSDREPRLVMSNGPQNRKLTKHETVFFAVGSLHNLCLLAVDNRWVFDFLT